MSFNAKQKNGQLAVSFTVLTGAAPQVGNGSTCPMNMVFPGTLSAKVRMDVKTSSLTMTPSWQVSQDASTWINVKTMNNAAQVATAAGTGSTVSTTVNLDGPASLSGWKYARAIVTTAGATADGVADGYACSYSWMQNDAT